MVVCGQLGDFGVSQSDPKHRTATFVVGGLIPLALVAGLTGLEFIIAFLQAYVFTILSCVYLNDALHLH